MSNVSNPVRPSVWRVSPFMNSSGRTPIPTRSNLVGMGVLPLEFMNGETRHTLGLTGFETFDIVGMSDQMKPKSVMTVRATAADGTVKEFKAMARIDTPEEMNYYRHGGILPFVLRQLVQ